MNKLYCFNQENNINNLIAIHHYDCKQIVIIEDKKEKYENIVGMKSYLEDKGYRLSLETVNAYSKDAITNYIQKIRKEDAIFLLPADASVIGYQLLNILLQAEIPLAYVEDGGDIYEYRQGEFTFISDSTDLDIEDYILSRGGFIKSEASSLFDDQRMIQLLTFIESHHKEYKHLFQPSRRPKVYSTAFQGPSTIVFLSNDLNVSEKKFLSDLISHMAANNLIKRQYTIKNKLIVTFKVIGMRDYLLKTGTWLEHRLYNLMHKLDAYDVEASLNFVWNNKRSSNNECDVVGLYENTLILASCKDTKKISPDNINEIYTIAEHLGNEESIKLLFTTSQIPDYLIEKGKEFEVYLVHYNYNEEAALKELKAIIH